MDKPARGKVKGIEMHKRIGILGGMSPESTVTYYEHITRTYTARFGDYSYPEVLIYSVNFQRFVEWQREGRWAEAAGAMIAALESLRLAGADFGVIATNTMHIVFDDVQRAVRMPLVSIMDAAAEAVLAAGVRSVGLLGTIFTMREAFYRDRLAKAGIEVLTPDAADQDRINEVIYGELCAGRVLESSRREFVEVVERLRMRGAAGIVLGCTEIPLLLRPQDCPIPLFNTTLIHAERALNLALER
jgi:aspartate racemase